MTNRNEIYKCNICGNIVEMLHTGAGHPVCCGQEMELLKEKTEDTGFEKHVPVIEKTTNAVKVKVGSIPHPMEEEHYIEWIELIANGLVYRKFLIPTDEPQAEFSISAPVVEARAYCNLHRLWMSAKPLKLAE